MKNIIFAVFLLFININFVSAQTDKNGALKESLVNLEKKSWEAWQKRDGKFFEDFLSDDHVEVGFYGTTNKRVVVAGVNSPLCTVKSYATNKFQLTVFDENTALLNYYAEQDTLCGGNKVPSPVWVSSLYQKRGGHWLNVSYQQTQALNPAVKSSAGGGGGDTKFLDDLMEGFNRALIEKDFKTVDKFLSPDWIHISANGSIENKQDFLKSFRSSDLKIESIIRDDKSWRMIGNDVAACTAKTSITINFKGQISIETDMVTSLLQKQPDNEWVMVSTNFNRINVKN